MSLDTTQVFWTSFYVRLFEKDKNNSPSLLFQYLQALICSSSKKCKIKNEKRNICFLSVIQKDFENVKEQTTENNNKQNSFLNNGTLAVNGKCSEGVHFGFAPQRGCGEVQPTSIANHWPLHCQPVKLQAFLTKHWLHHSQLRK